MRDYGGHDSGRMPGGSSAASPVDSKHVANFALQVRPLVLDVAAGKSGTVTVSLLAPPSMGAAAGLVVTDLPGGVTAMFGKGTLGFGDSTLLRLGAEAKAPAGPHTGVTPVH